MESSKDLATNAGKDLGKDFTNSSKILLNSNKDLPNLSPQESFFDLKIIYNNINYIYILLILIVLILIGYYLYNKYIVKNNKKSKSENKEEQHNNEGEEDNNNEGEEENNNNIKNDNIKKDNTKSDNTKSDNTKSDNTKTDNNKKEILKNVLNPREEYYVIDKKGNPILINTYIPDIINNNLVKIEEIKNLQNLNSKLQHDLTKINNEKLKTVQRPKLNHPGENQHIPENILLTEAEDENIATQDLTNEEIAELKSQLQSLQRNQKYQVSALNDEDGD